MLHGKQKHFLKHPNKYRVWLPYLDVLAIDGAAIRAGLEVVDAPDARSAGRVVSAHEVERAVRVGVAVSLAEHAGTIRAAAVVAAKARIACKNAVVCFIVP